jgi:hypothetical protein
MEHWGRIARHWAQLGPPLRPSPEDVAIAAGVVDELRPRRALVLGVTPELVRLPIPSVVAIDHTRAMIGAVLPRGVPAVVGDWRALPCAPASFELILGDGATSCLAFPHDYRALAAELARVVAPAGKVALRLFVAPARAESVDDVRAAFAAGAIAGFHAFKWRLAAALARDHHARVADVWRTFQALAPDRDALPWPRAVVDTIDVYRESAVVYSFATADEVRDVFAAAFVEDACHTPSYELGDRCPTIVWRVRC